MSTELSAAQDLLKKIEDLYILESKNADQQAAVLAGLEVYKSKSEAYLAAYEAMNTYYGSGEYKTDVSKVTDLDENIHTTYSAFIEENNTLVGFWIHSWNQKPSSPRLHFLPVKSRTNI